MSLEQRPFIRYNMEKKVDTFTVKLNAEERANLEAMKQILQQEKDSTALKQLAEIGSKVLLGSETKQVLEIVLNNYRRNKRLGIVTFD